MVMYGKCKKAILIILAMAVVFVLCACGSDPGTVSENPDSNSTAKESDSVVTSGAMADENVPAGNTESGVPVDDGRIVEGSFTDGNNVSYEYCYRIPQLQIESEAAGDINSVISGYFDAVIAEQNGYMDDKMAPNILNISWQSYENGNILSLVIKSDNLWGECSYNIFNYDLENNLECDTEDLLRLIGFDESTFEADVKKAAVRAFDKANAEYYESYSDPYVSERRAYTASNCCFDDSMFYLSGNELHGILLLGSPAGSGMVTADVIIENEPATEEGAPEQCNYGFVWGMKKENNEVYVAFEPTAEAGEFINGTAIDGENAIVGENMRVGGCYEKYTDFHIGSLSNGYFAPCMYLLTEDGHVEYVDIYSYVYDGTLCCGNVLTGVKDIVAFEDDESGEYRLTYGVTSAGEKIDLAAAVDQSSQLICNIYTGTGTCEREDCSVYFEISSDYNNINITTESKDGQLIQYWGNCRSLGINDYGQVISCRFCDDEDRWYSCCLNIPSVYSDSMIPDQTYIYIKCISGFNPFGTDDILAFVRSFG